MRAGAHQAASLQRRQRSISPQAPLSLRLRVYLTRPRLDRQIAAGAYATSDAIELRARQLSAPRIRLQLARSLREAVEYVDRLGSRPALSAVVIDRRAVSNGRHAILGLAERLEAEDPVNATGVVLVRRLLCDGIGPLFNHNSRQTVVQAVWKIVEALEQREATG